MDKQLLNSLEQYRRSKLANLRMFNYTMAYVSISSGLIEIFRRLFNERLPVVVSFFAEKTSDIFFSILLIILGTLIIVFQNNRKAYRIVLFILTCVWAWIAFSYLFKSMLFAVNFKHVLLIPILSQLLYMMKSSVFIDESTWLFTMARSRWGSTDISIL